jgi:hypothetical protein
LKENNRFRSSQPRQAPERCTQASEKSYKYNILLEDFTEKSIENIKAKKLRNKIHQYESLIPNKLIYLRITQINLESGN